MKHVHKSDDCWLWAGSRYPNGYGKFKLATGTSGGRGVLAHRYSYETHIGPIAGVINHRCETKACVNPAHLEDVTQRQNVRFSLSPLCRRGHVLDGDSYVSKDGKRACRACRRIREGRPRAGDIGEPIHHIEIEPIPHSEPIQEPVIVPVPDREEVPA